jgi:hypothetical protein
VEYGLTGPHWSAILTGAGGDRLHLLAFPGRPRQHATVQLAVLAVTRAFRRGLSAY